MTFSISSLELESITDVEAAFGTTRFLPAWDDVPGEFRVGNIYTKVAELIFHGMPLPVCEIEFNAGFSAAELNRAVRAHLQSFEPKHEHKIAGVGYLIAQVATIRFQP